MRAAVRRSLLLISVFHITVHHRGEACWFGVYIRMTAFSTFDNVSTPRSAYSWAISLLCAGALALDERVVGSTHQLDFD